MKRFKKMMALALAAAMTLAYAAPAAFAEDATTAAADKGSITIKSPVMGASYEAYRVFDMTLGKNQKGEKSYSYTIDTNSPFYTAVNTYANATDTTDADGLTLTEITTKTNGTYKIFNVKVDDTKFDAQAFGQAMEAAVKATGEGAINPKVYLPTYEVKDGETNPITYETAITLDTTDEVTFEGLIKSDTPGQPTGDISKGLPYGYYLIIGGYPDYSNTGTLTYYSTREDGTTPAATDDDADDYEQEVTINLQKEVTEGGEIKKVDKTRAELETEAATAASQAVTNIVTSEYVDKYIEANPDKFPGYADLPEAEKTKAWNSAKKQLEDSTKDSIIHQYLEAVNQLQAHNSDINVQTQRLVFIDSTTPNAEIIEKNELDKWDVPVNPENSAQYVHHEYGEPDGGKNIVVGYKDEQVNGETVKTPIYADWTEANVGDSIHYQLRVNAMNFIRTNKDGSLANEDALENTGDVKQVKEYILADSHKDGLKFNPSEDHIKVSIVDKNNQVIKLDGAEQSWDYTAWHELFFDDEALLSNGGGITIPWVIVTEDKTEAAKYENVTTNTVLVYNEDNQPVYVDENADPKVQKTKEVYICSKYDSNVTIVVDYTMTLTDKAVIDNPGNINTSQYGMNYIKPTDEEYEEPNPGTPPDEPTPKPDQESEKDTAKVYTYALALQKVDENNEKLAGATFAVKGLTVSDSAMSDGFYKVGKYDSKSNDYSVELKADQDGLLVLEGFSSSEEITIKEVKAPDGYNLLNEPIKVKPTKTGEEVVTTGKTTYYDKDKTASDAQITGVVDSKTHEKIYYKNGTRVAKIVDENGVPKYYGATDDGTLSQTDFNQAIAGIVTNVENGTNAKVATLAALETAAYKVVNKQGTELPSTGGIGTTLFYLIGAILIIGAGVLLVTRRRVEDSE